MTRVAAAVVTAVVATACSTYGWAGRPGETRVERAVYVRTVDVDAHVGADAGKLTRDFVGSLQSAGVAKAAWSGADDEGEVSCDVWIQRDEAFGETDFASASARCYVGDVLAGERDATMQVALDPGSRTLGRRRAAELAARRSLELVASDVADHLRDIRHPD